MKNYYNQLTKYYSIIQLLKYAILLTAMLFLVDILNLPSSYFLTLDTVTSTFILGILISLFILITIEIHLFDVIKIVSINFIDALSVTILFTSILYLGLAFFYANLYLYKSIILISVVLIVKAIIIYRGIRLYKSTQRAEKYKSNVIDLKDIYTGEFSINKGQTILINERDVEYDLLERDNVINLLYSTVQKSNPTEGFVISLEGKWGSGKTTIINNVKKKLKEYDGETIVIDEIDPWSYLDQKSLFNSMFDVIIQKSGIKFSFLNSKQIADSLSNNIFGNNKTSMIKNLLFMENTDRVLKKKINDYLKLNGKKVVIFIDNIDRAESENIIFLFKLVGNVFDFERVTYVLSFDNDRVKSIFENDLSIDYQYLKKIIQMQIHVPEIDKEVFNSIFTRSINNLLISYGESHQNLSKYQTIIGHIAKYTEDIRDFKRFINSAISIPFAELLYLDKRDLLAMEYIRINNLNLYQTIYQNRIFFISHDKFADDEIYSNSFNREKFNNDGIVFFENLFKEPDNYKYISLLEEVFPYVKKYRQKEDLEYTGHMILNDNSYSDIAKNKRICSSKYFELYFTRTANDYLKISMLVEEFISSINISTTRENIITTFSTFIGTVHYSYHRELIERLQLYINEIQEKNLYDLVLVLFMKISSIDDSPSFFSLSAYKR